MSRKIGTISEFDPEKEDWVNYQKRLEIWMKVNKVEDDDKANVFLALIGPKAFEVLTNLTLPDEVDSKTYAELTGLCKDHYKVERTEEGERDKFRGCIQKPGQTVTEFIWI